MRRKWLIGGIGATLSFALPIVFQMLTKASVPAWAAVFLLALSGFIIASTIETALESKLYYSTFDKTSLIAGYWEINVTDQEDRPKSLCYIEPTKEGYVYSGYSFSKDGAIAGSWKTREIDFDESISEMSFTADAQLFDKVGTRLRNYGYIKFNRVRGQYTTGFGYYVDLGPPNSAITRHMWIRRIQEEDYHTTMEAAFAKDGHRPSENEAQS